jgi:predicted HD phosphohydrolase
MGKWLAWQAWAQSLACVHVQGFLLVTVGQASRATGEILGPSDATQAGGWHSHLGRRVLSQVPAALQFEPISHVGVVSKYLCTAIPKWRSRQLVGTIRSRGAV